MVTDDEIHAFCSFYGLAFYRRGCPENWDDEAVFRASSNTWPQFGITIALTTVREWLDHPPYLGEGI